MKRSLIVAAISTLFLGAAQAEYTIYGLLDGSVGKNIADAQADVAINLHSGGDSGSGQGNSTTRIGLKGSNDIGSGVKANFKLETGGISSDGKVNNDGTFFNRQAWGSLSGSMGEIRFGRQDSVPFQAFIDYDYNGASNGVSAAGYSGAGIWALLPPPERSLQYISAPPWAAVKVQLGFSALTRQRTGAKNTFSAGADLRRGPAVGSASYETKRAGRLQLCLGGRQLRLRLGQGDAGLRRRRRRCDKGISVGALLRWARSASARIYGKKLGHQGLCRIEVLRQLRDPQGHLRLRRNRQVAEEGPASRARASQWA
jgi:hypothetical protein